MKVIARSCFYTKILSVPKIFQRKNTRTIFSLYPLFIWNFFQLSLLIMALCFLDLELILTSYLQARFLVEIYLVNSFCGFT